MNEIIELNWDQMVPSNWFGENEVKAVWLTGFHVMRLSSEFFLQEGPKHLDFGDAKVIIFYGYIPYVKVLSTEIQSKDIPIFQIKADEVQSPEGCYLLLYQPFDENRASEIEHQIRRHIKIVAGLLSTLFGPNIVYQRLFDNLIKPETNQRSVFGETFRNPGSMPVPNLSDSRINLAERAYTQLSELPEFDSNRIKLSLEWYFDSLFSFGVDVFLKCWFAIEALAMSERENINPLNDSLAQSYGISFDEARERFSLGKIYGFRNRIVHRGEIFPIHSLLSDYVSALYLDILFERLGLENEQRADLILRNPNFDIDALLYSSQ